MKKKIPLCYDCALYGRGCKGRVALTVMSLDGAAYLEERVPFKIAECKKYTSYTVPN